MARAGTKQVLLALVIGVPVVLFLVVPTILEFTTYDLWSYSGQTMGTSYTAKLRVLCAHIRDGLVCRTIEGKIAATLESVNARMSTYSPDSELSRFNAAPAGVPFSVSPETVEVFVLAREVSEPTGGAFDVTVGPLVNAWGFGPEERHEKTPDEATLAALRERVGYTMVHVDAAADTLTKDRADIYCDLSAIAKGYAVDLVAQALDQAGGTDYMVEVGGEVRTKGLNMEGKPWRIAIEKPSPGGRAIQLVVPLSGLAMATSGDYRNYYEVEGQRFSHTIDPRTGRPIEHNLASVTVLHDRCALADAYATALMVLGADEGLAMAERLGLKALLIVRHGQTDYEERPTTAFTEYLAAQAD